MAAEGFASIGAMTEVPEVDGPIGTPVGMTVIGVANVYCQEI